MTIEDARERDAGSVAAAGAETDDGTADAATVRGDSWREASWGGIRGRIEGFVHVGERSDQLSAVSHQLETKARIKDSQKRKPKTTSPQIPCLWRVP